MARRIRFIPKSPTVVEVTCRAFQGRNLFRPSRMLNQSIVGTLAVAKRRYQVRVYASAFLGNHFHLLLGVDDAEQLARFQCFVGSRIAREVGRITGWKEKVLGRRYVGIPLSDEPEAQIDRLRYILSQAVKEHLVERCVDWPGVHAAQALMTGQPLKGYWFDRSAEYSACRRGEAPGPYEYAREEMLRFDTLPPFRNLTSEQRQTHIVEMVRSIEAAAAAERAETGRKVLGKASLRRRPRRERHRLQTRRSAPVVHAVSRTARKAFVAAYRDFLSAYRDASARLRSGDRAALFPSGCFPPALSFVRLAPG